MTTDLQADLDYLATELDDVVADEHLDNCVITDVADRLRHLLDDRGIEQAPLTSEIIAWLEADPDHVVEMWITATGEWGAYILTDDVWRDRLTRHGDQRQYGYRLGVRKPATERVRLDRIIGRTLPGDAGPIDEIIRNCRGWQAWTGGNRWHPFTIDDDGTVEVLKVNPT
jgi:hypothetical protein